MGVEKIFMGGEEGQYGGGVRGQMEGMGVGGGVQPRMRLDLPPGGFLRPEGSPAAPACSAPEDGGASSLGSGPASASW